MIKEAKALEAAGCFSLVLECVPALVAAALTREVNIPTIGIGAGGGTSGQVGSAGHACGLGRLSGKPRQQGSPNEDEWPRSGPAACGSAGQAHPLGWAGGGIEVPMCF